ncbi:MAG: T9SS type A sorting domain-containing protein [Bacteroidetes bacterium]|nr:T9SS type A sorting domain-containing protein [Bacteroidota bacterium]
MNVQFQNSSKENIKLELRNNLGQLMIEKLFKANTSEFALDISGIPSGVYTCSVEGDQLRTVKKIIVE